LTTARPRGAFTLIELLVVIALIAILAALSAGAYVRLRATAMQTATEATLQKLASALDRQMRAVRDQARDDCQSSIPGWSPGTWGVSDERSAKAMYLKFKVRAEFPQSFAEARAAKVNWSNMLPASSGLSAFEESAVCLYLALNQARRGEMGITDEGVGAGNVKSIGAGGWKVFADNWGTPIGFVRWPYGNAELSSSTFGQNQDPQDPEGLLTAILPGQGMAPATRATNNAMPVIVSAGPDRQPGFSDFWMTGVLTNPDAFDNLYSYRLRRAGAKGN
jgi:prepilin-type N-terminal cleavage/methylation domain-containing protein